MANNNSKTGKPDRDRIYVEEPNELGYWPRNLGKSL
jgi:hypothetical protein